jgi:hypothetical protein
VPSELDGIMAFEAFKEPDEGVGPEVEDVIDKMQPKVGFPESRMKEFKSSCSRKSNPTKSLSRNADPYTSYINSQIQHPTKSTTNLKYCTTSYFSLDNQLASTSVISHPTSL